MNVRLMRLAEHEGTAITDALSEDLWKLLKLDIEPPPVVFQRFKGDWGGLCPHEDNTEDGEVQLNESLLSETRTSTIATAKANLVMVYLHEWAHRLCGEDHGHDAVFATVNLALLVRANPAHHLLAIRGLKLYDFHDHINQEKGVNLADAAAFVMQHGVELGNSDLPVSALAAEASARFYSFKVELVSRPQREAALRHQVEDLKRELWAATKCMYFALGGVAVVVAVFALLRH